MKPIKFLLANAGLLVAMAVPFVSVGTAQAADNVMPCVTQVQLDVQLDAVVDQSPKCDLQVDKQVSVNGGAYAEADTSADAVPAAVGDTVTWKVTVTNNSVGGSTPQGALYIKDLLPDGVSYQSYTATDGSYTPNDGSVFANEWYLPLLKSDGEFQVTTLPATLILTTKVTGTGLIQNTAKLDKDDPSGHCDGGCVYGDNVNGNNSDDAWIQVAAPQVLAASTTTPDTGFGTPSRSKAPLLIEIGLFGLAVSLLARRSTKRSAAK